MDYFLTSRASFSNITHLKVLPFTRFSDHCPVATRFYFEEKFRIDQTEHKFEKNPQKFKWKDDSSKIFQQTIKESRIQAKFEKIISQADSDSEKIINLESNILIDIADKCLSKTKRKYNLPHHRWYNLECKTANKKLKRATRRLNKRLETIKLREEFYAAKKKLPPDDTETKTCVSK